MISKDDTNLLVPLNGIIIWTQGSSVGDALPTRRAKARRTIIDIIKLEEFCNVQPGLFLPPSTGPLNKIIL